MECAERGGGGVSDLSLQRHERKMPYHFPVPRVVGKNVRGPNEGQNPGEARPYTWCGTTTGRQADTHAAREPNKHMAS